MANAGIIKELFVKTENKVGMLAEVTAAITDSGVNITALNAFALDNQAMFRIITSDNIKAIEGIKAKNFEAFEKEVVAVELKNELGAASDMARKLKAADIDITYIYGSTHDFGTAAMIVFSCNDNKKAVEVLK